MAGLTKTTHVFATHEIPLECDVYAAAHYPAGSPVLLFFHSGGLVSGSRGQVPPWLFQTCYQRKWLLVSASYRLMPQAGAKGLLEDASAAYSFARGLGSSDQARQVIVAGASAGFSLAAMVARHLTPSPLALLSITGISTFQHPFFNSSVQLTPAPITDEEVAEHITAPVTVGTTANRGVFSADMFLPTGAKNPDYVPPPQNAGDTTKLSPGTVPRGDLYDYYLTGNKFPAMMKDVDEGYEWTKNDPTGERLSAWPTTIFIQGDADVDVGVDVTVSAAKALGSKGKLFMAAGQEHLFESSSFIEDEGPGMDTVRLAVQALDEAVASARTSTR